MAGQSIDRRVQRTQAALHQALISLIPKKGYEALTVEEICTAADVSRSTFYAHYTGKDDLLRRGFRHLSRALDERQEDVTSQALGFSRVMFEHAKTHLDQYKAHVGDRAGAIAHDTVRGMLTELVRKEVGVSGRRSKTTNEVTVRYLVGAYLAVLTWWLDSGAKIPAEEIDALFRSLALDGVGQWLRRHD